MPMLPVESFFALTSASSPVSGGCHETQAALERSGLPLLDVRSPEEFAKGHIPGAVNLPLLSDEERVLVGTAHARSGSEAALHVGLELLGPQLAEKLAHARHTIQKLTRQQAGYKKEVLLYCWRGGMRSGSMSWLLETGGFTVYRLEGGYKAYRTYVRESFSRAAKVFVLGGLTGCGKTDILHALASMGSQILDLEGLANHRGSAFGGVGLGVQPNNERVENALHRQWHSLDFSRPIWVEDENRHIGSVTLCDPFYAQMAAGSLIMVDIPQEARIARLVRMYTEGQDDSALLSALSRIQDRLGGERHGLCAQAIQEHRYADATRILLEYYDKAYSFLLARRQRVVRQRVTLPYDDPIAAARALRDLEATL